MEDCSLRGKCLSTCCYDCDIANKLAEAEKSPSTYVTAKLTDEQFDKLLKSDSMQFTKSYHLFPNNAFAWFWIALAVVCVFRVIYN